ncbi:MAG: alpha/beta hydrolase [Clostridia bacterium]|nr:alpha/beta hydrolase [Clostridia bacterium]
MTVEVFGRPVSYIDSDPANEQNKPVLLFLHGWGAPAETYRLILDHLNGYCRVVAPDLPGFGGSEEPPEAWSVDDYVEWTLAFAAALGLERVILMNHSFGGRVSIKLLARDACALSVQKAVFMDAAGIRPKRTVKYYAKVYSYKLAKRLFPAYAKKRQGKVGSADYRNASPLMRQTMVKCINEDLTALLPRIRVSTLLIWGEEDTATPLRDGKLMEKKIPDAGLVVLPGAGHFGFAQQWGLCSRVLDSFLKG